MRFLRNIINTLIVAMLGLWALSFLGYGPFGEMLDKYLNPKQESLMERAQKIRNFDPHMLDPEFEIEKIGGKLDGFNTLSARHTPTGQRMYIADQNGKGLLSQQDLLNANPRKLSEVFDKVKALGVSPEGVEVTKTGLMNINGDEVPYAEFAGKTSGLTPTPVAGMITTKDDQIMASTNDRGKYSHYPDDGFFNNGRGRNNNYPGYNQNQPCVCQ